MKTAVILTTYNRPDALRAVLSGFFEQTTHQFELFVADDGSREDTGLLVEQQAALAPFPLHHVWQHDMGFRAAAVRNRAVARTAADYLIFVDGDCIPARHFVQQHCALAQPGYFLSGNRVLLAAAFTQRILARALPIQRWDATQWLPAWIRRDVNRVMPLLSLGDGRWRTRKPRQWRGVKTCNLSLWRNDFVRVNGFDESYSGWGLEDSDLVIRLLHAGIFHKSARFAAPVFHLWHRENDRSALPENQKRLDSLIDSDRIAARTGLNQYS